MNVRTVEISAGYYRHPDIRKSSHRIYKSNKGKREPLELSPEPLSSTLLPHVQFCLGAECRLRSLVDPAVNFCLVCLNNFPITCLSSRDSAITRLSSRDSAITRQPHHKETLSFHLSYLGRGLNPLRIPSFASCYRSLSSHRTASQWQEFVNFSMRSKAYQKVCPSFPGWGRFLLIVLLMATLPLTSAMSPPPNYSQSNMPTTNFTCADKSTGGYYADTEAHCQMFHVCVKISEDEMKDFRFLCPNDTVFDQQNFICTNWWEIVCERSTSYYSRNDDLFKTGEQTPEYEYENIESPVYYEYVYEYVDHPETTKAQTEEKSADERHRLSLGKLQHEPPQARAIEIATQKEERLPAATLSSASVSTTASTITTSTTTTTATTTTTTTTTAAPQSSSSVRTPHRLTFKSVSAVNRPSPQAPSVVAPRERVTSRGREEPGHQQKLGGETSHIHGDETPTLDLNAEDPFADYDWMKDSSGVTASARTRYEALFGRQRERGRHPDPPEDTKETPRPVRLRRPTQPTTTTPALPTVESGTSQRRQTKRRKQSPHKQIQRQQQQQQDKPQSLPEAKHKEFSNFRFYKTAFGRSYSSDDHLGNTGTTAPPLRVSDPIRIERIASRNTRYSIYA